MAGAAVYVQEGRFVEITPAGNQTRGDLVVMGKLVGVATKDAVTGNPDQVIDVGGVYDVVKAGGATFAVGDDVYWTGTNAAAAGATRLGIAILPAAGAAERVRVKLILS